MKVISCGTKIKSTRKIEKKGQMIPQGVDGMVMRIESSECYVKFDNGLLMWVGLKDVMERRNLY